MTHQKALPKIQQTLTTLSLFLTLENKVLEASSF